jgi:isopentenyl-diphosphate delta-isomerase
LLEKIAVLCHELPVPVIVKEVGCGISAGTAARLAQAGVAAIDVAGMGGTSFARVEALRRERPEEVELALAFAEWGIPTSQAIREVRQALPAIPLIASGGLRHGLDSAKAIALGAQLTGFAHVVLAAAAEGEAPVRQLLDGFAWQLRIAMFCAGAADLEQLGSRQLAEVR